MATPPPHLFEWVRRGDHDSHHHDLLPIGRSAVERMVELAWTAPAGTEIHWSWPSQAGGFRRGHCLAERVADDIVMVRSRRGGYVAGVVRDGGGSVTIAERTAIVEGVPLRRTVVRRRQVTARMVAPLHIGGDACEALHTTALLDEISPALRRGETLTLPGPVEWRGRSRVDDWDDELVIEAPLRTGVVAEPPLGQLASELEQARWVVGARHRVWAVMLGHAGHAPVPLTGGVGIQRRIIDDATTALDQRLVDELTAAGNAAQRAGGRIGGLGCWVELEAGEVQLRVAHSAAEGSDYDIVRSFRGHVVDAFGELLPLHRLVVVADLLPRLTHPVARPSAA